MTTLAVVWHFARARSPGHVALLALAALSFPVLGTLLLGNDFHTAKPLLWLSALVPVFALAHDRGAQGAAIGLACALGALAITELVAQVTAPEGLGVDAFAIGAGMAAVSGAAAWLSEALHRQRAKAERLALTDDLTGIWNRRRGRMFLDTEFRRAQEDPGAIFAVILFDLDSFKSYNDLHGHSAGDIALRNFARTLLEATRPPDLSARYGGEEFLTVLSSCDEQGALSFVDRVRSALKSSQNGPPYLTACAGIACFQAGMTSPNEILIAADKALYAAKDAGHDRAMIYAPRQEQQLVS
jgi:diguanylate cyclase (GGDEF)-like protein